MKAVYKELLDYSLVKAVENIETEVNETENNVIEDATDTES